MTTDVSYLRELGFALERNELGQLSLRDVRDEKMHPLVVDFLSGRLMHRLRHGLSKGQPLSRALGLKSLNPLAAPSVIDATAGLGTDALVMAALGCRVRAVERNPVVYALLEDGYQRLQEEAERLARDGDDFLLRIAKRLTIENRDANDALRSLVGSRCEVVYLDPMYPEEGRSKSALPPKSMQMFRRLIGVNDLDVSHALEAAIKIASDRVVVKRPLHAPPLREKPNHVFEGKTARFDMYLAMSQNANDH